MEQLKSFTDSRLIQGCIYCGGAADTRDHVPSKCILDKPYPENLPVVGCCNECNQNFSSDEQYFVCFIECVRCGTTNPEEIRRTSISRILKKSPLLKKRIENSVTETGGQLAFIPEIERIQNVMLKLAQGHVAFELGITRRESPSNFWCGLLSTLPEASRQVFHSIHIQNNVGEMGSRSIQRLLVTQFSMLGEDGNFKNVNLIFNDWIDVQVERYRYIAIHDMGMIIIRIVIDEFFGCEIAWDERVN